MGEDGRDGIPPYEGWMEAERKERRSVGQFGKPSNCVGAVRKERRSDWKNGDKRSILQGALGDVKKGRMKDGGWLRGLLTFSQRAR